MTVEGQQSVPTSKLSRDHSNESVADENGGGIPQNNSQTDCQPSVSIEKVTCCLLFVQFCLESNSGTSRIHKLGR